MELKGATVLVTGASSGIGHATAEAFASAGSFLGIAARRGELLEECAERFRSLGAGKVVPLPVDLAESGAGTALVDRAIRELGHVDVLVSNAGYGNSSSVEQFPPGDMERLWRVNYQSGYEMIHALVPLMIERGRGHLLQVSSVLGRKGIPFMAGYCVTKSAQIALAEGLKHELRGTGVCCSVVCPGSTRTPFVTVEADGSTEHPQANRRNIQSAAHVAGVILRLVRRDLSRSVDLTATGRFLLLLNRCFPRLVDWGIGRARGRR